MLSSLDKMILAKEFCKNAHNSINQKRKHSGEPYWNHPFRVSDIVRGVTGDQYMIIAAYLHDVLEDVADSFPEYGEEEIETLFGKEVLSFVVDLTDVHTKKAFPKLNRKERKKLEHERLGDIQPESKCIKLADIIDNARDVGELGSAEKFFEEKSELIELLWVSSDTVNRELYGKAHIAMRSLKDKIDENLRNSKR